MTQLDINGGDKALRGGGEEDIRGLTKHSPHY